MKINNFLRKIFIVFRRFPQILKFDIYNRYFKRYEKSSFGYLGKKVTLGAPMSWYNFKSIFIGDNTVIWGNAKFIIGGKEGRFCIGENCFVGEGLTVITNNHNTRPGICDFQYDLIKSGIGDIDKDVIVEDDVWIGANVTLLPGVKISRGAIIGACSVVTSDIPPYAVAVGNPAKVIKFKYSIEEALAHEEKLYEPNKRLKVSELSMCRDGR